MLESLVVNGESSVDRPKLLTLTKSLPQISSAHEKFVSHGAKFGFSTSSKADTPKVLEVKGKSKAKSKAK